MSNIKQDPSIRNLLNRMPEEVQQSFTEEQLSHLKIAIGARQWGVHAVDCRGVVRLFKYRYYFVLLAGRNRRQLSATEKKASAIAQATVVTFVFFIVLLFIYLLKSALGINLFEGFSLGIWTYFKSLFL
ncbi:3-phosphoshikimate 1-carboxyvinyltransferase [Pseudoalteromonas sp. NZS37]|uniref:3-phosphoshikimate 1-carboxyvinyltransferase n=1 Tax=Pseudoalteromonas sp. NZS37 TaxID=2792071 RepID=UPI0018CCD766|nr:3-phosphoshikimate 1-carboxyvinyltransferase [Pseudoalteromonas sp. NZS37]MBG9991704.1 3-phosphoshikimate 1-carboxyvinyltransferase [Pseudoalteromonas sp. NZS37]